MEKVVTVIHQANQKEEEYSRVNTYLNQGFTVKSVTSVPTAAAAIITFVLEKR